MHQERIEPESRLMGLANVGVAEPPAGLRSRR